MSSQLPRDWVVKESRTFPGKFYYANLFTHETRWSHPDHLHRKEKTADDGVRARPKIAVSAESMRKNAEKCLEMTDNSLDCVSTCVETSEDILLGPIEGDECPSSHEGTRDDDRNNQSDKVNNVVTTQKDNSRSISSELISHDPVSLSESSKKETTATAIANRKSRDRNDRSRKTKESSSSVSSIFSRIFGLNGSKAKRRRRQTPRKSRDRRNTAVKGNEACKATESSNHIAFESSLDVENQIKDERSENDNDDDHGNDIGSPVVNHRSNAALDIEKLFTPSSKSTNVYTPLRKSTPGAASRSQAGLLSISSGSTRNKKSVVLEKKIFDNQILIVKTLLAFIVIENLSLAVFGLCYYYGAFQDFQAAA